MTRILLIALMAATTWGTQPHTQIDEDALLAVRYPFQGAVQAVERVQAEIDTVHKLWYLSYMGATIGDGVEMVSRADAAALRMQIFDAKHGAGIALVRELAAQNPDSGPISELAAWLDVLLFEAGRMSEDAPRWAEIAHGLGGTDMSTWQAAFAPMLAPEESIPMPAATGGTVTEADGYRIHTFTTSDDFVVTEGGDFEYLVVAGGGGGGGPRENYGRGGGGGAGGLLNDTINLSPDTYPIVIGAGGNGGGEASNGGKGSDSTAFGLTAEGGGGGGRRTTRSMATAGGSGGSGGGGGGGSAGGGTGGAGTAGQGYAGGNNGLADARAGGGGGAGGVGEDGGVDGSTSGGDGGDGLQINITGTPTYYAGGGGGGQGGSGGLGGGANANASATANTGGGGGGANASGAAGNGGSGIVIVRYLMGGPGAGRQYRPFTPPLSEIFRGAFQ